MWHFDRGTQTLKCITFSYLGPQISHSMLTYCVVGVIPKTLHSFRVPYRFLPPGQYKSGPLLTRVILYTSKTQLKPV